MTQILKALAKLKQQKKQSRSQETGRGKCLLTKRVHRRKMVSVKCWSHCSVLLDFHYCFKKEGIAIEGQQKGESVC